MLSTNLHFSSIIQSPCMMETNRSTVVVGMVHCFGVRISSVLILCSKKKRQWLWNRLRIFKFEALFDRLL